MNEFLGRTGKFVVPKLNGLVVLQLEEEENNKKAFLGLHLGQEYLSLFDGDTVKS